MKTIAQKASAWLAVLLLLCALPSFAATPTESPQGRLVSARWLQQNLARPELVILDASPRQLYKQGHIPGAIDAELFSFGPRELAQAQMQQLLRSWGISAGKIIVIVDQGGTYQATRLFWDLVHQGLPETSLHILDGGMAYWKASGGAISQEATPKPAAGSVHLGQRNHDVRVKLPEFLAATADPHNHVMLEALDPAYYYGGAGFFNRAGHVPHATLMPSADFFNADKTFKSPAEIARMLAYLGIKPEQQVLTYCGGGGAAAVPFFALKYMLGYPRVKLFSESQMAWLQDPRELPVWTYAAPHLARDTPWVKAWGSPMLKAFGLSAVSIVDVRPAEAFKLGHLPLAVNLPALAATPSAQGVEQLAALLGQAGVERAHEAVVVSEGGLNERSALAFLALERLGQHKVSIYLDSVERWAEQGLDVARPTANATASPAKAYAPALRTGLWVNDTQAAAGPFPRVVVATGLQPPQRMPEGRVVHLPYTRLLNADGKPKPAPEIWKTLEQAGVPRYAELLVLADAPGEAAAGYVLFKLMGWPDVKVWAAP